MKLEGKVWRYGDNIDTDVMIPARYLNTSDVSELASHCMEDLDPDFKEKVQPGDIIVAGSNFGCGSSREHAPVAIKGSGIACVIAPSFARIFYRNSINTGLPILECAGAAEEIRDGDIIEIDTEEGKISDITSGKIYKASAFPEFISEIIGADGLVGYTKAKLK